MSSAVNFVAKRRYAAQVFFIIFLTTALTYGALAMGYRSGWNAVWMFLLPMGLALTFNKGWDRRAFMALALPIVAFMTVILTGAVLNSV